VERYKKWVHSSVAVCMVIAIIIMLAVLIYHWVFLQLDYYYIVKWREEV
jgi:FlaG/FlaF family flagellin (archaellin)